MQNKGFVRVFAVLLTLVCAFYLSFSFVTRYYNDKAAEYAGNDLAKQSYFLDSLSTQKVWLGYTLKQCREMEINLGLDLKGGMNVILELNVADVLKSLSNNNQDPNFIKALELAQARQATSSKDFISLFSEEYLKLVPNGKLSVLFSTFELKDKITPQSTNTEVESILREEMKSAIDNSFNVLRTRIDRFGVVAPNIQRLETDGRILVELPGIKEPERVRKLLQGSANLEFWETYELGEVYQQLVAANNIIRDYNASLESAQAEGDSTVAEAMEAGKDTTGLKVLDAISQGDAQVSQSEAEFAKQYPLFSILNINQYNGQIGAGPAVGVAHKKDMETINNYLQMKQVKDLFPRNLRFFWTVKAVDDKEQYYQLVAVKASNRDGSPALQGDVVTDARADFAQNGRGQEVSMAMNAEGAKAWSRVTKDNIGKSVAIVLDGLVYSYPNVNDEITGGRSQITGNFTPEEAKDLANVLKSGKMAASVRIVQEDVVGPSLGQAAIEDGAISFALALICLMLYMCSAYGLVPGMIANAAMIVNVFFTLGILASFHAVLTLSGIAGMVLTLGMAVDANVLIYERAKEELRAGKNAAQAMSDGYKNAFSAIFDSNLTTIITGVVLFYFGTGPIRGFATTLIIGLISSFITAVFLTRLVYEGLFAKGKLQNMTLTTSLTKNLLVNPTINFLGKRKVGYLIPVGVIVIGIISMFTLGLNKGIDFTGGRNYIVKFDNAVNTEDVREMLSASFDGSVSVIQIGTSDQVRISTNYKIADTDPEVDQNIEAKLYEGLKPLLKQGTTQEQFSSVNIQSSQKVGPSMADDIKVGAFWAIVLSMLLMGVYILFRFRDIAFSVGTVASVIVNVGVIFSFYSLLWKVMPFSMEIDQTFIAAILTIIGYSLNDTVVVFDRIRETLALYPKRSRFQVINDALNSTLARTFSTSFSTLVVVLCIFLLGGSTIRSFTFAILIGIVSCTYSTLFVATPVAYELMRRKEKKNEEKK